MGHLTEQFFAETGDNAMYRKGGADYHTLRYVKWLEAKVEKFTSTNKRMAGAKPPQICPECDLWTMYDNKQNALFKVHACLCAGKLRHA